MDKDLETPVSKNGNYITEHIKNVTKGLHEYGDRICKLLNLDHRELEELVAKHDISKFSKDEFEAYANYFFSKDGGKNEAFKDDFNLAWLHHENTNQHHPEYWVLRDDEKTIIIEMPDKYIAEMILDWQAMSYKFGDTPLGYYNKSGDKKPLGPQTRKKLEKVLKSIYKEG